MVRILGFHCRGLGSIPGRGTDNPQATQFRRKEGRKEGRKKERTSLLDS